MRPRVVLVFAIVSILLGGALLVPAAYARLINDSTEPGSAAPTPEAAPLSPPPPPTLAAGPVSIDLGPDSFVSWALLDRESGEISGSKNIKATNSTESMIKIWFVADYLRQLGDKEPPEGLLRFGSLAIRDSDDDATNVIYRAAGGEPSLDRLITMCGLTETKKVIPPNQRTVWWSYTAMSARDAVRMGECVKSGKAAGPKWTKWVLDEMTKVRGTTAAKDQQLRRGGGRWGIIDGLPEELLAQGPVGIKNGWTMIYADMKWHINCLAVADDWVLAVLMRYPHGKGLDFGSAVCRSVTEQLVTPQPGAVLKVPQPLVPEQPPAQG
ncbi:MAG TPA: serine hydrolase [Micromonospora sp.]|nr:serine hydrolase [Micromonospora sp.]